jgi:hypothetical protein
MRGYEIKQLPNFIPSPQPSPDGLIFTHIFSEHKEIEGMVANLILDFQVAAAPW